MKKNNLQSLFNPKSIAIVGASNKKGKVGTVVTENILRLGYKGKVFLVNPSYKFLRLRRCYFSLSLIGSQSMWQYVSVPAKFVADVVKDGAKNVKILSSFPPVFPKLAKKARSVKKNFWNLQEKQTKHSRTKLFRVYCKSQTQCFIGRNARCRKYFICFAIWSTSSSFNG